MIYTAFERCVLDQKCKGRNKWSCKCENMFRNPLSTAGSGSELVFIDSSEDTPPPPPTARLETVIGYEEASQPRLGFSIGLKSANKRILVSPPEGPEQRRWR